MSDAENPERPLQFLGGRVFDIPDEQFSDLISSIETKRLRDRQRQKADVVLKYLRPRLTVQRPLRRPTPQRLLCLPFEDLLYDPGTRRKAIGKIPRRALGPLWSLFVGQVEDAVVGRARDGLKDADLGQLDDLETIGAEIWAKGATILGGQVRKSRTSREMRVKLIETLGGEDVYDSLEEAALALSIAVPLSKLRRKLPIGPVDDFNRSEITLIAETLKLAAGMNQEAVPHVVYVMMARLADPGALIKIFEKLSEEGVGDLLGMITAQVSEAIVNQTEDRLIDIRDQVNKPGANKTDVARTLGQEFKTLDRTAAMVGRSGRGMTRRMDRVKSELTRIADDVLVEGSGTETAGLIDTLDMPSTSVEEEYERMRAVEARITALRLAHAFGGDVGIGGRVEENLGIIETRLIGRANELTDRLAAQDPTLSRENLNAIIRLMELTAGPEKADRLRLKAKDILGN